eukprot:Sspe_Gene.47253::Locus_23948_Transcript_1_1_Confidence_1.000_Length_1231::g.47253::m.47253/K18482/ADCL; 4-amino-4-deoxychorismate lyase
MEGKAPPPIVGHEEFYKRMTKVRDDLPQNGYRVLYNSLIDAVVKDVELMAVPIDDHMVVRGHAVFDTCALANGRLYRLQVHLERFFNSARMARLRFPFPGGEEENRLVFVEKVKQTVAASGARDGSIRMYWSAGPGDFSIRDEHCKPALYIMVYGSAIARTHLNPRNENIVPVEKKSSFFSQMKSTNYLHNCLVALNSADKNGLFGIQVDQQSGEVLESSIMNTFVVTKDKKLKTPPFLFALKGCTARRVMEMASEKLVPEGLVAEVVQETFHVDELRECVEIFLTGGDVHLVPVISLDGKPVGDGEVGGVTKRVRELLDADLLDESPTSPNHITVDYSLYS